MPLFARSSLFHALSCALAAVALMLPVVADELPAVADELPVQGVNAVWKVQAVELNVRSFDVVYSCVALQAKIASILRPIVAHQATKIGIRCSDIGIGAGTYAKATLLLTSPIEATSENLRAMTTFDARAQLVARVRAIELPTEEDVPRFAASWQRVSLVRGRGLRLDAGDCELVRSIREQVLPQLAVKVTRSRNMCGMSMPLLEVEALLPIAPAKAE